MRIIRYRYIEDSRFCVVEDTFESLCAVKHNEFRKVEPRSILRDF